MIEYNIDMIVSIETMKEKESERYYYREKPVRFLWSTIYKKGWYDTYHFGESECMGDNPEFDKSKYYLKGNKIMVKPRVRINYIDKDHQDYFFDTYEQAEKFSSQIKSKTNSKWIQ